MVFGNVRSFQPTSFQEMYPKTFEILQKGYRQQGFVNSL